MASSAVPKIFLSWGSPDKPVPHELRDRLRDAGLDVWEYTDGMPAGANIPRQVLEIVNQVDMAILCFSDETAERDWIQVEAALCYAAREDESKPLQFIVPVWVGPHPKNKIPAGLKLEPASVFDLSGAQESDYHRLVVDIVTQFGSRAPRIVPAALFAMTRAQFQDLFQGNPPAEPLASLCRAAGMADDLLASLEKRYGDTPEDLAPFQAGQKLCDVLDDILRQANELRIKANRHPIVLRWVRDELLAADLDEEVRTLWESRESLLIVDSVSTLHPDIQKAFGDLPELTRTALLWLPPFTHHTVALEPQLYSVAKIVKRLGYFFSKWKEEPGRAIAFDMATSVSFRLWLHRTFDGIQDEDAPLEDLIGSLPKSSVPPPGQMMRARRSS